MTSPHPEPGHDEFETIPWATLAEEIDRGKHRTMALTVAAAVAVGILAFMVVRTVRQPPGTVVEVPSTSASVAAPGPPATTGATASTMASPSGTASEPAAPAVPAGSVVYSEADLRAGVPDVDMRLAVARAEWFVSEYFSTGEVGAGVLPEGTIARTVPEGSYSWVEWARSIAVEATGQGRYEVTVVFRTVAGDGERPVAVTPVRAVRVPVVVDESGASGVADLPSPVPVPGAATADALPVADREPPEAVASAALEIAAEIGGTGVVVGGTQETTGWRVVVEVTDRSGATFPVAVFVSG
ncbi:MAG: hypothetical protein ABWY62_04970 [Acidimicrobiia bacterium]